MRTPVRRITLAVPSVGCSNSACLALHRSRPDIVPLVHQHGCSQLGDDVDLTREILARLMANPNVSRSLVIGLGCESNQSSVLASAARRYGAAVAEIGIQDAGGLSGAVSGGLGLLDHLSVRQSSPHSITVGLMADDTAGETAESHLSEIADLLGQQTFRVLVSPQPPPGLGERPAPIGAGVTHVWRGASPGAAPITDRRCAAERREVRDGVTDVERLTALTAAGAEVTVLLTGDASGIGSPIAPTVKVSLGATLDGLDDLVDVPYRDGVQLAQRAVRAILEVAAGQSTAAERGGARDVALWRLAPTF
jgi:altronate dehydratase